MTWTFSPCIERVADVQRTQADNDPMNMTHDGGQEKPVATEDPSEPPRVSYLQFDAFERRGRGSDRRGKGHWAVPWSDLMMTMFVFFAVLYIYQLANREWKPQEKGGEGTRKLENVVRMDEVSPAIQESFPELYELSRKNLSDNVQVELVQDKAIRITVTNDLLFETGKADLKPGALTVLDDVAGVIMRTPYIVNVVGHTDNMPIRTTQYPTNWELSSARACSVVRYMTERLGIPGDRFFISAHAYFDPIRSNLTEENRSANRRVEIIITRDRPS